MAIKKTDYLKFGENLYEVVPPLPSEVDRGGIIASPKTENETVEVKLGNDGKLYVPETDLTDYYNKVESDSNLNELKSSVAFINATDNENIVDPETGTVTTIAIDSALSSTSTNPVQNKVIKAELDKKANTSSLPTKISQLTNDSGFITSIPSEYVTDTELNAKGFLTQHQDLSPYAKTSQIPTKTSQLTNDSNFVTKEVTDDLQGQIADQQGQLDSVSDGYVIAKEVTDSFEERVKALETMNASYSTVSSVDEMTDTSQKYILESTGTIWEYQETTTEIVDADVNLYNIDEVKLNQNPDGTARNGYISTGLIPVDFSAYSPFPVTISGNGMGTPSDGTTLPLIYKTATHDTDGKCIAQTYSKDTSGVWGENTFTYNVAKSSNVAYVSFLIKFNNSAITIEDVPTDIRITTPIGKTTVVTTAEWINTGVSSVSGDYNIGDIVLHMNKNIKNIENHDDRLALVENAINKKSEIPLIPNYWKVAVDALEDKIKELQNMGGVDSFQCLWVSDIHGKNGYANTNGAGTSATTYIGAIARYIMDKYDIPCIIISGDIMSQASHGSEDSVWAEYDGIRVILSPIKEDELLAVKGNHDGAWGSPVTINGTAVYYLKNIGTKKVYNAIYRRQAKDRTKVFGKDGTYFYTDIHGMRIFMLNAHTDGDGSVNENGYAKYNPFKNSVYGQEQLEWLCNSFKTMKDGQKALVVAHPQLAASHDGDILAGIIKAFNDKTTYSGNTTVSADYWENDSKYANISISTNFTNTNGKVIAYVHGHNHIDRIYTYNDIQCIAITTAGGDVRDSNPVERILGTATETAMDILTINDMGIYMTRVGAGSDRVIALDGTVYYSIKNNLTNVKSNNNAGNVVAGNSYSATITANTGYELADVVVTMGGTDITSTVYADGKINIAEVTGNVVITASATKIDTGGEEIDTNNLILTSIDKEGNIVGLIKNYRYNSSDTLVANTGTDATGYIPIKAGDVVRFENIIFRNETLNNTTPGSYYIRLYDSSFTMCGYAVSGQLQEVAVAQHFANYKLDSDGDLVEFTVSDAFEYAWMRMAFISDTEDAIITVNEEITGGGDTPTPSYTNLADPTSADWKDGYRFGSSGESAETGKTITNYIPVKNGDVVRIKGATITASADRIVLYKPDKAQLYLSYIGSVSSTHITNPTLADGVYTFNVTSDSVGFFRFAMSTPSNASDVIVTVNEEI